MPSRFNIQSWMTCYEGFRMTWRSVHESFHKHGHEWILVVVTMLAFVLVWPVGEYLILDDWAFAKSLEHLHKHGELVVLDWNPMTLTGHLLWGLLFTKLFGYSFLVTKIAVGCAGALVSLSAYWISKRHGAHPTIALIAGLAILLNPLFLIHLFMYMTDVTGLMWQWLSLGCLSLGFSKPGRRREWLLVASSVLWGLAFLTRQHGVTVPVAFGAYILIFDRSLFHWGIIGRTFLPGIWVAANGFVWQSLTQGNTKSFRASSSLVREFVLNPPWFDLPYICWCYFIYIGLFAAPLVLSIRWSDLRPLSLRKLFLMIAATWVGLFLFIHYSMNGRRFPYVRNVITPWGAFQPQEFVTGDRDLLWLPEYGIAAGFCGLVAGLCWVRIIKQPGGRTNQTADANGSVHPICARRLLFLLFVFQLAYVLVTSPILYDRHLILLLPTVVVMASLVTSKHSNPRLLAPAIVLLGYAAYGIVCSHDVHAVSRAVFLEGERLLASGVRAERIDAGYAFDGWHMYERSHAMSPETTLYMPPWWPSTRPTTASHLEQPWWISILTTQVKPEYVVAISANIPHGNYQGQYRFEEIECTRRYWTYWPLREQKVHLFRCHRLTAAIP